MLNFALKYAPSSLDDVVFPSNHARNVVEKFVAGAGWSNIIFHGNYGTGKSTLLHLLPELLFTSGTRQELLLNGFGDSSLAAMRKNVKTFADLSTISECGAKLVIIDEFDGLSAKAQASFKGLIGSGNLTDTWFLMATNNIGKIDGGVKSRCTHIKMDDFDAELWLPRVKHILSSEEVPVSNDDELTKIVKACRGDYRSLMRVLEDTVDRHKMAA